MSRVGCYVVQITKWQGCIYFQFQTESNSQDTSAVKVSGEQTIDPALLFQRLLAVSQTGDIVALVEARMVKLYVHSMRSSVLTRNVISSKAFAKSEKLPPTSFAMQYNSLRTLLQVMTNFTARADLLQIILRSTSNRTYRSVEGATLVCPSGIGPRGRRANDMV